MTSGNRSGGEAVVSSFLAYILDHFPGLSRPGLVETWGGGPQGKTIKDCAEMRPIFPSPQIAKSDMGEGKEVVEFKHLNPRHSMHGERSEQDMGDASLC